MSTIAKVKLYEGQKKGRELESKHNIKIVATRQNNEAYGPYDSRKNIYSVSVFYDDEFVLNYVVLDDEWDLIKTDLRIKVLDDLNYVLIASAGSLKITKNVIHGCTDRQSDFVDKFKSDSMSVGSSLDLVACLRFLSVNRDAFCEALKVASNDPFVGQHLFYNLPKDLEFETVEL